MACAVQGELVFRSWGGRRAGAGRPPTPGRRRVAHRRRTPHDPRLPVHVTLRAVAGLRSLRGGRVFAAVRRALAAASGARFRILQFSVQSNHVHLLVEADSATGVARGCQGLAVRVAKTVNRVLRRHGRVWAERYHAHWLRTPREMRHALVYVLQNIRKHAAGARGLDPCSSAPWFTGWRVPPAHPPGPAPVRTPRTWLARSGWTRYGLLDRGEGPRRIPGRRENRPLAPVVKERVAARRAPRPGAIPCRRTRPAKVDAHDFCGYPRRCSPRCGGTPDAA